MFQNIPSSGPPRPFNGAVQNLFGESSKSGMDNSKVTVKKETDDVPEGAMKTTGTIPANIQVIMVYHTYAVLLHCMHLKVPDMKFLKNNLAKTFR